MALSEIELKFSKTTFMQFLKQNLWDFSPQEYGALTSIKNYLGERWGFQYAFMNFYTSNLMFPALVGLPIFIFMLIHDDMRISQFLLAVLICFWMTIFIEKWKRKENELRFVWGVSHIDKEDETKIRP